MRTDAPLNRTAGDPVLDRPRIYRDRRAGRLAHDLEAPQDELSPASIRNVMADLADDGYLSQPHTSAGRVPTEKAFRFYVVTHRQPGRACEAERLRTNSADPRHGGARVERSSYILMEMTRNVGIAAAMPALSQELEQMELIPLADRRVLMILVTRDGWYAIAWSPCDEPISPDELISIRNYVNRNFSGWLLGDARRELVRRMAEERAAYDATHAQNPGALPKGPAGYGRNSPEVHMEGASNLLGLDLHLTREKMRELMRALEEKKRLIELLDRFLEQPPGELAVKVGLEDASPAMKELALIGMTLDGAAASCESGGSRPHADALRAGHGRRPADQPCAGKRCNSRASGGAGLPVC